MIIIKDVDTGRKINFEITQFPDGTSQAWKLTPPPEHMGKVEVIWMFENEAELVHICQIGDLLNSQFKVFPTLNVPYLPFGRQDKPIKNNQTFARATFVNLVYSSGYSGIKTLDVHSNSESITNIEPKDFHDNVIGKDTLICFPDLGASTRYKYLTYRPHVWFYKVRNQETGEIQGMGLQGSEDMIKGKNVVIVDDICDGGATFIGVAKELKRYGAEQIDLCISHGIFSKALSPLWDAGIHTIYTTNSLLSNYGKQNVEIPSGQKLTVHNIIDLQLDLDYNDLKRQDRKGV